MQTQKEGIQLPGERTPPKQPDGTTVARDHIRLEHVALAICSRADLESIRHGQSFLSLLRLGSKMQQSFRFYHMFFKLEGDKMTAVILEHGTATSKCCLGKSR